jgi:serine/threonine protein kinase
MPDTNPKQTLDTDASTFRLHRLESAWLAWHAGKEPPSWQHHLPADDEPCSPNLIFSLLALDIERRIQAGLPALLAERYFEHPRLQRDDARLDDARQLELIQGEYLLRLQQGERPRRAEYEAEYPRHLEALCEMKPRSQCSQCHKILVVEETFQTPLCPDCGCESSLLLTAPPFVAPATSPIPATADLDPRKYQLLETLGKGGMGEVYRSCDPSLGRDLAIKVIKGDHRGHPHVERRFLREARITGSLQHPGIVPIHNLGRLADGRLHYTMRLVRGQTFAEILKQEAGKPERLPYLLSIFEKICQAVAYAHSKRVLHRDLKPSNVMVGKFGEVQVMDWGLAKLLTPEDMIVDSVEPTDVAGTRILTEADTPMDLSRPGSGFGTPAYMPSEQALGEWDAVDERADVFALGSILCELLTREPAYSGTDWEEVYRQAKRGDVTESLERLQQRGAEAALTALCCECLNSNRDARPRDAGVVAKRVSEYLSEVQERLQQAEIERAEAQLKVREVRRRRRLLAALVVVLLAGGGVSTWLAVRATASAEAERKAKEAEASQRKKAEDSEAEIKAVLAFFQEKVLAAGRPEDQEGGLGKDVKLRDAVDKAEKDIADSFKDRSQVEAAIRNTLGNTYLYLGEHLQAIEQHGRALALREAKRGLDHSDTLDSRNNLAAAYLEAGRIDEAIRLHEQNLKMSEAKLGPDHPDMLNYCNNLANAYREGGRIADAIRLHEKTLQQRENKLGPDHPDTLTSRNNLAWAYYEAGRLAEAISLNEQNLKLFEAKLGPFHQNTLVSRNNLATAYETVGRTKEAIRLLEENLKQQEARLGPNHPDTLTTRTSLATAYWSTGRTSEAIPLHEQTLKQREAKLGADHPATLLSQNNLAAAYLSAGRTAEAIRLFDQNLKQRQAKFGPDHPDTLWSMGNLGQAYLVAGRLMDAIRLLEDALQRARKNSKEFPAQLIWIPGVLAETYDRDGQFAKAEAIYRDFLEQARRQFGSDDPRTAEMLAGLSFNQLCQHKFNDAERLLRDCLKIWEAKQLDNWLTFNVRSLLGSALLGQKKYAEAEPLLLQGYDGMKAREAKIRPRSKVCLTEALERLVQLYEAVDKKDEAVKWRKQLEERKAARNKPKS